MKDKFTLIRVSLNTCIGALICIGYTFATLVTTEKEGKDEEMEEKKKQAKNNDTEMKLKMKRNSKSKKKKVKKAADRN